MTQKKAAKRESSDNFQRVILDNVPVSIITIDKKGIITSVNKYFKKFSETGNSEKINIFRSKFFQRENLVAEYKKLLTVGGVFRKENVHEINSKGEDKYLSITAVPFLGENGRIEGIVSMAADNTEAVIFKNKLLELNNNMEVEVKKKTKDLAVANKELSQALELKSTFVADVSHEFRTSLAIMQSSLELLRKSDTSESPDSGLYKNIFTEIKRVAAAFKNLSELNDSVQVAKKFFKKFDLHESIALVCRELKVVADQKGINIRQLTDGSKTEIFGNKDDIEKLLLNLIRNAITYNKHKGWIKVWLEKTGRGVKLKVQDSGIGIPSDQLKNIFERFYRVDRSRLRNKSDSGLGLAICKYVAEEHGGHISVKSRLGVGSTFCVYLPLAKK